MSPSLPSQSTPFLWQEDGVGLRVESTISSDVAPDVFVDPGATAVAQKPFFVGSSFSRTHMICASWLVIAVVVTLMSRAFWMQVVDGARYQARAEQNRLRHDIVPAARGLIRDQRGRILADNIPSFDVQIVPAFLPTSSDVREEIFGQLGRLLSLSLNEIHDRIASSTDPTEPLTIARNLSHDRAVAVSVLVGNTPAVLVSEGKRRRYPESPSVSSLSHVLGYTGVISPEELSRERGAYRQTEVIGKTGIEASYEARLRGTQGERDVEINALSKPTSLVRERDPVDGADITLTLHLDLQRAAEQALQRQMNISRVRRGAVIALHPQDGAVLALVSLPAYDNNIFSGAVSSTVYRALIEDMDTPLLPRAWAGVYPSGSTIKPIVAVAALAEGIISPHTSILSTGGIRIGGKLFPDWKDGGHGPTDVRKAIAWSVNTFFYTVGGGHGAFAGLGVDRLTTWLRRFGFGEKTGLDVPGEGRGLVPSQEWKETTQRERWYVGDTYNLSIGQGSLLVTPMHIAAATAAIANGGKRVYPHLIADDQRNGFASSTRAPSPLHVDPSVIQLVRLGMRDTILHGSGRALAQFPVSVAGKTGTAQWRNDRLQHAWFTSFAPFEKPEIVVTVLIEEGGEGSAVAVPVARDVLQAWHTQARFQ